MTPVTVGGVGVSHLHRRRFGAARREETTMSEHASTQTQASRDSSGAPSASEFTPSPLRNRIRVELGAPVSEVWELMGDLSRFPEYSVGLERVEVEQDADGRCTEYTCYFKALEQGSEGPVSRDVIKWYEPNRGYLSVELEGNTGTKNTLALMTLDPIPGGARVTYDMHFDAEDLDTMKTAIDESLVDIADNLIARFGGRVTERYVEQ
jgi:Polyketide cyclase / dehydrase and lipid transport